MAVEKPEEPKESEMKAIDFFQPWQSTAKNWSEAMGFINAINNNSYDQVAWRGVRKSSYALHSSLYRYLFKKLGAPPSEKQMVEAEIKILEVARKQWRFGNLNALEAFAQIQHYGGPTRLLDVSFNPLIALWFAVEEKFDSKGNAKTDTNGRLFAFDIANQNSLNLDGFGDTHEIPWNKDIDEWQTNYPSVWRPPGYNERISAQNSGFLVGGVPIVGGRAKYKKSPCKSETWSTDEVQCATSVTMDMREYGQSAPSHTLEISAHAKKEIREKLEKEFGYKTSSVYPDLYGLGTYLKKSLEELERKKLEDQEQKNKGLVAKIFRGRKS